MAVSTVSTKGQVTLPAQVRKKLGIKPNDRVIIEAVDDAVLIRRAPDFFALKGFLGGAVPEAEERGKTRRGIAAHVKGDFP